MITKKVLLTHSYKGGSGKTVISINLAVLLASKFNKKVLFIDGDLLAPSLDKVFPPSSNISEKTWPDYLDGICGNLDEVIFETSIPNLDIIYSPSPEIGKRFLTEKKMNWWVSALKKQLLCRDVWFKIYDYVIIDNQNGISMNSANNLATSDIGYLVVRPAIYAIEGTIKLIKEMYKTIQGIRDRRDFLIWNQIPVSNIRKNNLKVKRFLKHWDTYFQKINVEPIIKINYNANFNITMLESNNSEPIGVSPYFKKHLINYLQQTFFA